MIYYVNTDELPDKLSHKKVTSSHMKNNMLSPHVKRSMLLCLQNKLHFSGVEKLRMSQMFFNT